MEHGRNPAEPKRVGIPLTEAELAAIDEWGFAQRIRARSDAIRALLKRGLEVSTSNPP